MDDENDKNNVDSISDADINTQEEASADFANIIDDANLSYYENYIITTIIDLFTTESRNRLSSFLRKKIIIKLNTINSCSFEEVNLNNPQILSLNFQIAPYGKYGIIAYDYSFIDFVINLLYGGSTSGTHIMQSLGKSGFKIVSKISEVFLVVLQEVMIEQLKVSLTLSNVSLQPSTYFKQEKQEKCYNFCFSVLLDSLVCNLSLVLPTDLFVTPEIGTDLITDKNPDEQMSHEIALRQPIFDESGKKNLIESNVTISVTLAPITLKLNQVVNLQAGDILPIGDPTLVYVALNKKTLFRASSGQSNHRRVIKIIDTV